MGHVVTDMRYEKNNTTKNQRLIPHLIRTTRRKKNTFKSQTIIFYYRDELSPKQPVTFVPRSLKMDFYFLVFLTTEPYTDSFYNQSNL